MEINPEAMAAPARSEPSADEPPAGTADAGTFAPRPDRRTIALRGFLPIQVWRFFAMNLRMARIIFKSHD